MIGVSEIAFMRAQVTCVTLGSIDARSIDFPRRGRGCRYFFRIVLRLGFVNLSGFNQPNEVVVGPDGSVYVADGHDAQNMTTTNAVAEGIKGRTR